VEGSWHGEIIYTTADGRDLVLDLSTSYLRDPDGRVSGSVTVSRDITTRKDLEAALVRSATHDALTDLLNRAGFTAVVEEALAGGEPSAVAFVDLNAFKVINDTWGHETGDEVLQTVAARLRRTIRPSDRAARFGGDEFVVLLRGVEDGAVAAQLVDRFAEEVQQPIKSRQAGQHLIGASIGVAVSNVDDTVDTLLSRADDAMYEAKRASSVRTASPPSR
jgi:diguanylate cyclase (GGDEF)-like protein